MGATHRGRPRRLWIAILGALLTVSALPPLGAGPTRVQAANSWEAGAYRDFTPPTTRSVGEMTRAIAPAVRLSRTLVQRPRVLPGSAAALLAEYEVSSPSGPMQLKETRIIRFEGQQLAKLERQVERPTGIAGSEYQLKIPAEAAPGWYTVTTTIEPLGPTTHSLTRSASAEQANAAFYVDDRSTPAAAAPVAAGGVDFKLWSEKPKYKVGEAVTVLFQSSVDGYVTLVNIGTSGRVTILYPNAYAQNHGVKRGQVYSVPAAGDPYTLTLGGPAGVELVYALFTTRPARFVEENFAAQPFSPVNEKVDVLTRDINIAVKKLPLKEQAKAVLEIEVAP